MCVSPQPSGISCLIIYDEYEDEPVEQIGGIYGCAVICKEAPRR